MEPIEVKWSKRSVIPATDTLPEKKVVNFTIKYGELTLEGRLQKSKDGTRVYPVVGRMRTINTRNGEQRTVRDVGFTRELADRIVKAVIDDLKVRETQTQMDL